MVRQRNVPKLRFSEFTGVWTTVDGDQVFNPITNKDHNSDLPILAITQEYGAIPRDIIDYKISVTDKSIETYKVVEEGDYIISLRTFQGGIEYSKYKGICSPAYIILRPTIEINKSFFMYYFKTNRYIQSLNEKIEGIRDGKMVSFKYFSEASLTFPTLPEQQQIASFLTVIDNRLQLLKKKKALLEQYKKGVTQKLFSRELRFKDDGGNEFPKWSNTKFGEIYSFRNTNSFSRDQLNYQEGNIKNIHYGDIHKKFKPLFDITKEYVPYVNPSINIKRINDEDYCKEGDLVIADASEDYSDIGKCIEIINLDNKKTIAGLHTLLARPDTSKMSLGFGNYLMKYDNLRMQIKIIAQGTKVLSISSARLSNLHINIPCVGEQVKIVKFLTALDKRIDKCGMQTEETTLYKKGLLQKMFC
jgi:type I restriction enzyme S subunit